MKTFIFFARVGIFLILCVLQPPAFGRTVCRNSPDVSPNYVVVIGAFAIESNAVKFTEYAKALNFLARFDIHTRSNLYFVYVLNTNDRMQAINEALRLRKDTEFFDAWVYRGAIGSSADAAQQQDEAINPETGKTITKIQAKEGRIVETTTDVPTEKSNSNSATFVNPEKTETEKKAEGTGIQVVSDNAANASEENSSPATSSENKLSADEIEGKNFIFQLIRTMDNQSVEGEVDVVDAEKSRKLASYKANTPVKVTTPGGRAVVTFVCEVFGYRKVQKDFNFQAPVADGLSVDNEGNVVVPFELVRLQKGDIAVMYNVYFFKDAAVMRPESRFEVTNLLEMLKENTKYKIRIHGHTNGNAHGKIIMMGDSKNFFALSDTKDGFGSAKKLSYERASAIKEYLVSNGIEETRMSIKAWGGKRAIHDKHATRAQENVRVEVEILDH